MSVAPDPSEIFKRSAKEGERRLDQSLLELMSTGAIAGFTIVFGIVALGTIHAVLEPDLDAVAKVAGALSFGIGVVFLVVGRAELFSENFFDPVAAIVKSGRSDGVTKLLRLWSVTLVLNLVGGSLFALVFSAEGVLAEGAHAALRTIAEEIAFRELWTGFLKAIAGGALVTLLSFLLAAVNSVGSRIAMAYLTGFLLSLGPFDHVVVTELYLIFGIMMGAELGVAELVQTLLVVTAGNLVGGLGLVTLTHIAQAKG